jgi:PST family polysaccharide transporter
MPTIKEEMVKGVMWSAVGKYSGVIVQLIITAVLARLITPEEFGVVAIATVLIAFLTIFSDLGLGAAIIQRQDFGKEEYDSIYSFSIYLGIFLSVVLFFSSPFIASFYDSLPLKIICQILSVTLFFGSINMVPNAIISKQKRFKFIAQRTLFFQVISGILAIVTAFCGWGCYALLIPPILSSIGCFIVNYRQYPLHFNMALDISPVKSVFSYSSFLLIFNVMNYFTRNLDKLLIGRFFSMQSLGYYDKSYHLMMLPLQQITHVITPVMHPVLTSLQSNYPQMALNYSKILKLLATLGFPLGVFLYFSASNLIAVFFGEQWLPAVPVFKILSLSVPVQMLIATTGGIFQASGRTDWMFYAGIIHSSITIIGFMMAVLIFNNIESMAWSFVITMNSHTFLTLFIIYHIIFKQSYFEVIKLLHIPALNSFLLSMILLLLNRLLIFSELVNLIIQFLLSLVITSFVIHVFHQYDINKLWNIVIRK